MTPPGHLAVGYLLARGARPSVASSFVPAVVGALLPDLIDKPALWLGLTPYGRTVGHSVLVWALCSLIWSVALWWRRGRARTLAAIVLAGWLSHLLVDLADDVMEGLEYSGYVFSAWFGWPLTNPDMWNVKSAHLLAPVAHAVTMLELLTVAACLWLVARQRSR